MEKNKKKQKEAFEKRLLELSTKILADEEKKLKKSYLGLLSRFEQRNVFPFWSRMGSGISHQVSNLVPWAPWEDRQLPPWEDRQKVPTVQLPKTFDLSCGDDCCPGRKYKDCFNFTSLVISSKLNYDHCAWLYGMNVFDLQTWRKTSITATYHQWLKLSLNSGFELWNPGALPPSLIAFEGHVHRIYPSWHIAGLGYRLIMNVTESVLEDGAVLHFSGPAMFGIRVTHVWYEDYHFKPENATRNQKQC
ncbi:hypothetical protein R3W88_029432 [Solanum pinnatisectum]|uniref:Hexosyltransferase n=1 Tax=Solanum pinnatisectum TaxID=50273 RepID=A0AAV9K8P9_9SOLN|nr:hypothetical protein R3W88_029432 [Solanum pinnatisectum]